MLISDSRQSMIRGNHVAAYFHVTTVHYSHYALSNYFNRHFTSGVVKRQNAGTVDRVICIEHSRWHYCAEYHHAPFVRLETCGKVALLPMEIARKQQVASAQFIDREHLRVYRSVYITEIGNRSFLNKSQFHSLPILCQSNITLGFISEGVRHSTPSAASASFRACQYA